MKIMLSATKSSIISVRQTAEDKQKIRWNTIPAGVVFPLFIAWVTMLSDVGRTHLG